MKNVYKLKLNISDLAKGFKVDKKIFKKVAKETLALIGFAVGRGFEINLAFIGESEMKKLNRCFLGKNKTTDVLSFSEIVIPQGKLARKLKLENVLKKRKLIKKISELSMGITHNLGGEKFFLFDNNNQIVICLPYAEKQAKKLKLTLKQELAMLLSHGILHILGYDHERSKKEAKIMDELQNIMTEKFK